MDNDDHQRKRKDKQPIDAEKQRSRKKAARQQSLLRFAIRPDASRPAGLVIRETPTADTTAASTVPSTTAPIAPVSTPARPSRPSPSPEFFEDLPPYTAPRSTPSPAQGQGRSTPADSPFSDVHFPLTPGGSLDFSCFESPAAAQPSSGPTMTDATIGPTVPGTSTTAPPPATSAPPPAASAPPPAASAPPPAASADAAGPSTTAGPSTSQGGVRRHYRGRPGGIVGAEQDPGPLPPEEMNRRFAALVNRFSKQVKDNPDDESEEPRTMIYIRPDPDWPTT